MALSLNFKIGEPIGSIGRAPQCAVYSRLEVKSDLEGRNVPLDAKRDVIHRGDFGSLARHSMVP